MSDPVNHPSHYADGWSNGAEVIDITEHLNFNRGNAVKYIARAGKKDPESELQDLQKAAWYLNREINRWDNPPTYQVVPVNSLHGASWTVNGRRYWDDLNDIPDGTRVNSSDESDHIEPWIINPEDGPFEEGDCGEGPWREWIEPDEESVL